MKSITRINPTIVLRIYKRIKRNPLKVWVARDFGGGVYTSKSLKLLDSLHLIKVVPAIYRCGRKSKTTRTVKGYKLKLDWEKKDEPRI